MMVDGPCSAGGLGFLLAAGAVLILLSAACTGDKGITKSKLIQIMAKLSCHFFIIIFTSSDGYR